MCLLPLDSAVAPYSATPLCPGPGPSGEARSGPPPAARPSDPLPAYPSAPLGGVFARALLGILGAPPSPCRGAKPAVISKCQHGRDARSAPPRDPLWANFNPKNPGYTHLENRGLKRNLREARPPDIHRA